MVDPRLNSVHLDPSRREMFRHAREMLLQARGNQTVFVEKHQDFNELGAGSKTQIEKQAGAAIETDFCLMDRDCVYPLKVGINTVGRSSENDVVVADAFVSRRHCAILVHHSTVCELYDTASKNGTFLNGNKISGPTRLRTGDEIRMCDRNYIFVSKHDASAPAAITHTLHE
jgi:pSer/pThr/pTyr-binding forkhead associated (FHA) protein